MSKCRVNRQGLVAVILSIVYVCIISDITNSLVVVAEYTEKQEVTIKQNKLIEKIKVGQTYKIEKEKKTKITNENEVTLQKEYSKINIDSELFNKIQVRLNTEIYQESESVFSQKHITMDYGKPSTELYSSYLENITPIVPIALSVCETGMWADTKYTWCPAIYSKLLRNKGVDLSRTKIAEVTVDTYIVNDLCISLGCGSNCTADKTQHYHTVGNNDNDSLGPLQILRHYVEADDFITYPCGESTNDLMNWHDSLEYIMHVQTSKFANVNNWNRNHKINSTVELVALMAIAHNTGSAYLSSSDNAGSLWKSPQSVYDYCSKLGSEESIVILSNYIDSWQEYAIEAQKNGQSFLLAGQRISNAADNLLEDMGIDKMQYARGWSNKQYYPLLAVLNYLSLERLYYSGEDRNEVR